MAPLLFCGSNAQFILFTLHVLSVSYTEIRTCTVGCRLLHDAAYRDVAIKRKGQKYTETGCENRFINSLSVKTSYCRYCRGWVVDALILNYWLNDLRIWKRVSVWYVTKHRNTSRWFRKYCKQESNATHWTWHRKLFFCCRLSVRCICQSASEQKFVRLHLQKLKRESLSRCCIAFEKL